VPLGPIKRILQRMAHCPCCGFVIGQHRAMMRRVKRQDRFHFAGYVVIAILISHLANRLRYLIPQIRESEATVAAVAGLSKDLVDARGYEEMLEILARHMRLFAPGKIAILIPDDGGLRFATGDNDYPFTDKEMTIARWVYDNGEVAGRGTDTLVGGIGHYVPMKAHGLVYGVLAFAFQNPEAVLSLETKGVPVAMAQVGALSLERVTL
ncbi:MAG TPA: hypothetical protein PLY13_07035, partial [Methanoregulaceae archaeon]|nr:hypothetical protein [Methanoregulaceae archaeon]